MIKEVDKLRGLQRDGSGRAARPGKMMPIARVGLGRAFAFFMVHGLAYRFCTKRA